MPVITQAQTVYSQEIHNIPALIPVIAEDVFTSDTYLLSIHLVNTSDNPVSVTITDKQTVPMSVVPNVEIDPHSDHVREFSGRYCPGGVVWVASVPDAVVGYIRGRQ